MPSFNPLTPRSDITLWTGGWDSTFRVLQRAVVEQLPVHPCYLVECERHSAGKELDAMNSLRRVLEEHNPEAAARIKPTRYFDRTAIPESGAISDAWEELRGRLDIGKQYKRLAWMLEAADWTGVELSIYGGGRIHSLFGENIQPVFTPDGRPTHALTSDAPEPLRAVFGRYVFPFWEIGKQEASVLASRMGLAQLLKENTWFCHNPEKGKPCGMCRPCRFVVNDGFAHRIPASAHLRHAVAQARMKAGIRTRVRKLLGLSKTMQTN